MYVYRYEWKYPVPLRGSRSGMLIWLKLSDRKTRPNLHPPYALYVEPQSCITRYSLSLYNAIKNRSAYYNTRYMSEFIYFIFVSSYYYSLYIKYMKAKN